jgi:phospholipid/cholesterol/gamma-HCH transport system permease protein
VASSVNAAVVESVLVLMIINIVVSELYVELFPRSSL